MSSSKEANSSNEKLHNSESDIEETVRVRTEKVKKAPTPEILSDGKIIPPTETAVSVDEPTRVYASETRSVTPSSTYETRTVETSSTTSVNEESISDKAREAGRSLKDLVYSLGKKTKDVTEQKADELKAKSVDIGASTDAHKIRNLGSYVYELVEVFEDTMTEIRKEPYGEQERLLTGYRKLLEEQINVINARLNLARRLKPGS